MKKIKVGRSGGAIFGGNANNGTNAGLAYVNSNNTPSNTNSNIGSHLSFKHLTSGLCLPNGMTWAAALPLGRKHRNPERCW